MTYAAQILRKGLRRVLFTQAVLAVAVGIVASLWGGHHDAWHRLGAALAGGGVTLLGTAVLGYTVGRADNRGGPVQAQLWLYGGAAVRFLLAIVLLGVGLGVFHVSPLPFLIAFGLGQIAFLAPGISSGL